MIRTLLALFLFGRLLAPAAEIHLYPTSGGANLRVPPAPTTPGGAKGKVADFESLRLSYALAPHLTLQPEYELNFHLRDLPRRLEKTLLVLTSGKEKLELRIAPASEGRELQLRQGKTVRSAAKLPAFNRWQSATLRCREGEAELSTGGTSIRLPLPRDFAPKTLTVAAALIDELTLVSGNARLVLDWEEDYAARLTPAPRQGGVSLQLFGFDSYVVGTDPARRDTPVAQLINTTAEKQRVTLDFTLKSEVNRLEKSWRQSFEAAPGSESVTPIQFPFALQSDLYHLEVKSSDGATLQKHFLYAEPRREAKGPGLFGLHDCNVGTFGVWPDQLPLRYAHQYLYWGYVVGPAWVKDWNGAYGIDPATPSEEWNWNHRIDWALASGRELYVCLQSQPFLDWQRERPYPRMKSTAWGTRGGFPKLDRYSDFLRATAQRYKGKIQRWEVENEPNASTHLPDQPGDYAEIAKTVTKVMKETDPQNLIYGICGTGAFVPWMGKAIKAGAGSALDVVSWHTYTTPAQPDRAGLAGMLEEAKKQAPTIKRYFNSETGVLMPQRYRVDEPIPPAVVAEKIAERHPAFVSPGAWPGKVNDEYQASSSMVKNAVINLTSGAEGFIFFGWNPLWPKDPKNWEKERPGFGLFAATPAGERTPTLTALAVSVLAMQFEGVVLTPAPKSTGAPSIPGGIFRKANGGETALLWSAAPTSSVLLSSPDGELEQVSLFGERSTLKPIASEGGVHRYLLNLTEQPVYLHAAKPGFAILPSPVEKITVTERPDGLRQVRFTLLNRSGENWRATIVPAPGAVKVTPARLEADVAAKKRRNFDFTADPAGSPLRELNLTFTVELPGGGSYQAPVVLSNRPTLALKKEAGLQPAAALDKVEQAIFGGPSKLASLQEDNYWNGPDELSAKIRLGCTDRELVVEVEARDLNLRTPSPWPGANGSAVELFFDFRPEQGGLGEVNYAPGVSQFLLRPAIGNAPAAFHSAQLPDAAERGVKLECKSLDKGYLLTFTLPWRAVGLDKAPSLFGFDLGINGSYPDKTARKTQLMLFGTTMNFRNAADFGRVRLQ